MGEKVKRMISFAEIASTAQYNAEGKIAAVVSAVPNVILSLRALKPVLGMIFMWKHTQVVSK